MGSIILLTRQQEMMSFGIQIPVHFVEQKMPKPKNKLIKLLPIIALDADMNFLQLENIKKMICEDGKV
mgnify:CR=1 FL=1